MSLRLTVVQWIADDFPGRVRATFVDVHGQVNALEDKAPVFDDGERLTPTSPYPLFVDVPVEVLGRHHLDGREVVSIRLPYGLMDALQQECFDVAASDLIDEVDQT